MYESDPHDADEAPPALSDACELDGFLDPGHGIVPISTTPDVVLRALIDTDLFELEPSDLLTLAQAVQAEKSRWDAVEAVVFGRLAGAHEHGREVLVLDDETDAERRLVVTDEAREEIAAALHRSPATVDHQLTTSRLLSGPLADTLGMVARGELTMAHASGIAHQAARLGSARAVLTALPDASDDPAAHAQAIADRAAFDAACQALQDRVLPKAGALTPGQTKSLARKVVAAIDADGAQARRERAAARQDVWLEPADDDHAYLTAYLPVADALRAKAAIDARAQQRRIDALDVSPTMTIGQHRVAALVDAVCGRGTQTGAAGVQVRAEIGVVVDLPTLLGLAEHTAMVTMPNGAPEPVSAQALRDLLADDSTPVTLRRLVTDPLSGHLLDRGRRSYEVTEAMRAFIVARDGTCRFPGCTRSARRCQVDHVVAWNDGGSTDRDNLGALCTRHHQLKTHGGWDITGVDADGTVHWRSPTGRRHAVKPPPVLPHPEPASSPPADDVSTSPAPPRYVVPDDPPF